MVDGVSDYAIFTLDADGHVASWNTGAERIKGYRADEIIGRHFSCFLSGGGCRAGEAGPRTGNRRRARAIRG